MDPETLFTSSKWRILSLLGDGPKSPYELARLTRTSMANISQQLRFLEFAGLVAGTRVPNREREKPRVLYSLARSQAYLIATAPRYVRKAFVPLDPTAHLLLHALFAGAPRERALLLRLLPRLEGFLERCHAVYLRAGASVADILLVAEDLDPPAQGSLTLDGDTVALRWHVAPPGAPPPSAEWALISARAVPPHRP